MRIANNISKIECCLLLALGLALSVSPAGSADGLNLGFEGEHQGLISARVPSRPENILQNAETSYAALKQEEQQLLSRLGWENADTKIPAAFEQQALPSSPPAQQLRPQKVHGSLRKQEAHVEILPAARIVSPEPRQRLMLTAEGDDQKMEGVMLDLPVTALSTAADGSFAFYRGERLVKDTLKDTKKVNQRAERASGRTRKQISDSESGSASSPSSILEASAAELSDSKVAALQNKIQGLESTVSSLHSELQELNSRLVEAPLITNANPDNLQRQVEYRQHLHQGKILARVAVSKLVLRIGPADHYSAISSLPKGTSLKVLNKSSSWTRVECESGLTAWAPSYGLQFTE